MSEYQYYEFLAIDEPLDEAAQKAVRALSSRAEISSTSFVNTYNYGDFRGNPAELTLKYYDAFLYIANWGTHWLMLRLLRSLVDVEAMRAYCSEEGTTLLVQGDHVLLSFRSEEEGGDWEEGEGWLASLVPLRDELLAGDLRCLYLAWLSSAEREEFDDDEREPPLPPGLGKLSAAQRRFVEFMRIDEELVRAAAGGSAGEAPAGPARVELAAWLATLPASEKDGLLLQLIEGEGRHLGIQLLRRFQQHRAARASGRGKTAEEPRRTVGALLDAGKVAAEEAQRQRQEAAARKQAEEARKQAKERARYLETLAPRAEETWGEVEQLIETKLPKNYDQAVALLCDLRDLAAGGSGAEKTATRIRELRQRHAAKRTFVQRLDKAGLPK